MTDTPSNSIHLTCGDATADIALRGAEPMSWRVDGRELLWHGDPAHWSFRAPILFPLVGASRNGLIHVEGVAYPMPQHGFARHQPFALVSHDVDRAAFRLSDSPETRAAYPFPFTLDVTATLRPAVLELAFTVTNTGERKMPYGLGVHPAFPWPFAAAGRDGHAVLFDADEGPDVPEVAVGGLLARRTRHIPLEGRRLPLSPDLFTEALVFLDSSSRAMSFEAPSGAAITLAMENFPHLAVWTRPTAPFLSLEAWTAHAEWEDGGGELAARDSLIVLAPGETRSHAATMAWRGAAQETPEL